MATLLSAVNNTPLAACVASAGRFHLFDLGFQLQRLGYLRRFYTGYPSWRLGDLPGGTVVSFPWMIAPMLFLNQRGLEQMSPLGARLNYWALETFDRWTAARLEECDVFHFLSGCGRYAQRIARHRYGAVTVCDKGSTHVLYQDAILADEHSRWGIPYRPPFDPRVVARELEEYEEADVILVPSQFSYRSFVEMGTPAAKLRRIPYGVDTRLFRPIPREDDIFRVIYVGMLNLRKGLPYLLEAVAPLRLPGFELWLIGLPYQDGKPFLRKYEGSFRHFGYVKREELYKYYSQASVFVIASIEEGLATVQAQAMACGLPVIATRNTGAEDLFDDGVEGFIVPIRDPLAIREKVLYLYYHPDVRDAMSEAALRRAAQLRGWDSYGEAVVGMYRKEVASSSRACQAR